VLASSGVVAVFTGADTARAGFKSTPQLARYPGRGGATIKVPHRDGLANGRVRFVGQEIALVVAETALAAQDAAEKIEVEYRDLPAVVDAAEALAPGAEQLYRRSRVISASTTSTATRQEPKRPLRGPRTSRASRWTASAWSATRWSPRPVLPPTTRRRTGTTST